MRPSKGIYVNRKLSFIKPMVAKRLIALNALYLSLKIKKSMKYILLSLTTLFILASCGIKVPLTADIKKQYNLDEDNLKNVQFYVSDEIILEQSSEKGTKGTTNDGTLVNTESNEKSRLIILPRTKCVFDGYVDSTTLKIRFENGAGRTLTFAINPNRSRDKYYFKADWVQGKGR